MDVPSSGDVDVIPLRYAVAADIAPLIQRLVDAPGGGRSAGSLAWAGLANTYFWIDPVRDVSGVILMQVLPFADPVCLDAFAAFERGIYTSLSAKAA